MVHFILIFLISYLSTYISFKLFSAEDGGRHNKQIYIITLSFLWSIVVTFS